MMQTIIGTEFFKNVANKSNYFFLDYVCSDCNERFETASFLLKHFAFHVGLTQIPINFDKSNFKVKRSPIPDLYPIKSKRRTTKTESSSIENKSENEDNVDSGFEDVNPIKYQFTMTSKKNGTNELLHENAAKTKENYKTRHFTCIYCSKSFEWSTDLKRHTLVHNGERPFKCDSCKFSFTRNFFLQRHKIKYHGNNEKLFRVTKMRIPLLKPLDISIRHKTRKQDKSNIKRNMCSAKAVYQIKTYRYS